MIVLLNGAFGIGKTTVARALVRRLERSVIFDPEMIGIPLQRAARVIGTRVDDFQDLRLWRTLTVVAIRVVHVRWPTVIVPMAISNVRYLHELQKGLERFDPAVVHVCLVADVETVHARLQARGADPLRESWSYRRATECCAVHSGVEFAHHVRATGSVEEVTAAVLAITSAHAVPASKST